MTAGLGGGRLQGASARMIHHADWNACDTFEAPDTIVPRASDVEVSGGAMKVELPPLSVVTVTGRLG